MRRKDQDPPAAVSRWGWRYHHVGIPRRGRKRGESWIEACRMGVSGFTTSPYGIEWMRFERGSPVSKLVRTVPHVAFEVKNIKKHKNLVLKI